MIVSEEYNGKSNVFGSGQVGDIASGNLSDFLKDVLFFNNTSGGTYNQGVQNRRINDLVAAMGITATFTGNVVTGLNFSGNVNAAQAIAQAITQNWDDIDGRVDGNTNLTTFRDTLLKQAEDVLIDNGQYVVQPGDANAQGAFADITSIIGGTIPGLSAESLADINQGATYTPGTVLRLPQLEAALADIEPGEGPLVQASASGLVIDVVQYADSITTTTTFVGGNGTALTTLAKGNSHQPRAGFLMAA
jgi:hypothetical protein